MRALPVVAILTLSAGQVVAEDPLYACKEAAPNSKLSAAFAPETSLADLITWTMGFSCKNVVVAPGIAVRATKVTILAPKQMTPKQAMQLFVDAVESGGFIVTQKPDTIIIKPGPNMPKTCPDIAGRAPTNVTPIPLTKDPVAVEDSDDELQKLIDTGIKKINEHEYHIDKKVIDAITTNPMAFMKGARVVPAMKNGKPEGIKLYAIRPSSPYAKLGLTNGDTLVKINGHELTDADKGLEVYQSLRTAKRFELQLIRRGTPVTLVYVIK